jgi:hypothetical protein
MDRDRELAAEHEALRGELERLHHEHEQLRKRPHDRAAHAAHRHKLEAKKEELQAHRDRLVQQPRRSGRPRKR